jgi:xylulokinase
VSLVLGVDVGSQSIKVVLVDEGGDVVATGSAALSMTHQHDGWAEQDPQTYCTALRDAIRAATADIEPTRIVAMGLGSQVDGVVACDADGKALRPAIIWLDKRATEQCDRLVAAAGEDTLAERTGLVADASHSAPKMMWIRDHEPPHGDARAGRLVSAAPPDRLARPGRRERVVHDGVRRRPR